MALGKKTSVYLACDLYARWRKSGVPLATLVREALDAREQLPAEPPPTLEDMRHMFREELSAVPAPVCRAQSGYAAGGYDFEPA